MTAAQFRKGPEIRIGGAEVQRVKEWALASPMGRARLCLHGSREDPLQEMVLAFRREFYVRPHRQGGKEKSYLMIEGEIDLVFFNDQGSVVRRVRMAAGRPGLPFLYRFQASHWHTLLPQTSLAVLNETILGPFSGTEFAPWAPANEDSEGIRRFLEQLRGGGSGPII